MKKILKYIYFILPMLIISCNKPTFIINNMARNSSFNCSAVGLYHTAVLKSDTTIWSAGDNSSGQLGNGTTENSNTFIQMKDFNGNPINNVAYVATGSYYTVVLKLDGTIWSTGDNSSGQLGDGTTKNSLFPIQMKDSSGNPVTNVISIATGDYHTIFLKSDGSIWSIGSNFYGQLGNGTTENSSIPIQMKDSSGKPITDVINIFAKSGHSIFIKSDGSIWITGEYFNRGNSNILNPKEIFDSNGKTIKNIIDIATGSHHTVFLKSDGSIWGIGDNSLGQLGYGYEKEITSLVQLKDSNGKPFTGVKGIAAGNECTFILKSDNSIWSAGYNYYGQLGYYSDKPELTFKESHNFTENAIANISGIVSGKNHTLFLKADGTIWASGNNIDGQLGNKILKEYNDSPIKINF